MVGGINNWLSVKMKSIYNNYAASITKIYFFYYSPICLVWWFTKWWNTSLLRKLLCGWTERGQIIWKISSCWWIYVYGWMACICLLNAQILNEWISRKNYHCFVFLCFFISIFIRKKMSVHTSFLAR